MHVLQVACGSSHSLFLNDLVSGTYLDVGTLCIFLCPCQGRVYAVGLGDSGQLGLGPHFKFSQQPTCIPLPYEEYSFLFITAGIAHNGGMIVEFKIGSTCSFTPSLPTTLSSPHRVW